MALDALFDGTIVDGAESTVNWFEDGALPAPESWSEVLIQGLASNGTQSSSKDGVPPNSVLFSQTLSAKSGWL